MILKKTGPAHEPDPLGAFLLFSLDAVIVADLLEFGTIDEAVYYDCRAFAFVEAFFPVLEAAGIRITVQHGFVDAADVFLIGKVLVFDLRAEEEGVEQALRCLGVFAEGFAPVLQTAGFCGPLQALGVHSLDELHHFALLSADCAGAVLLGPVLRNGHSLPEIKTCVITQVFVFIA